MIIQHLLSMEGIRGCIFEREVIEGYLALNHHCQASIVGSAESYNEQFRSSPVTLYSKSFLTRNIICEIQDDLDDDEDEEVSSECKKTSLLQCGSY